MAERGVELKIATLNLKCERKRQRRGCLALCATDNQMDERNEKSQVLVYMVWVVCIEEEIWPSLYLIVITKWMLWMICVSWSVAINVSRHNFIIRIQRMHIRFWLNYFTYVLRTNYVHIFLLPISRLFFLWLLFIIIFSGEKNDADFSSSRTMRLVHFTFDADATAVATAVMVVVAGDRVCVTMRPSGPVVVQRFFVFIFSNFD